MSVGCATGGYVRNHDVVCRYIGGGVVRDPVSGAKGDVVGEGVCAVVGNGKWTVALLAGDRETVGKVLVCVWLSLGVKTDTFGGWRGLEAPECAAAFPGGTDEGVVNVDAEDAACAPRAS